MDVDKNDRVIFVRSEKKTGKSTSMFNFIENSETNIISIGNKVSLLN